MLFVSLFFAALAVAVVVGCFVLLTVSGLWVIENVLIVFIIIMVMLLALFLAIKAAKNSMDEMVYWF